MPDKPYVFQEFPKVLYHATEPDKTVKSREEQDALGEDWVEHPSKLEKKDEAASSAPAAGKTKAK